MPEPERQGDIIAGPPWVQPPPRRRERFSLGVPIVAGVVVAAAAVLLRSVDPTGLVWLGLFLCGLVAVWRGVSTIVAARVGQGAEPGAWIAAAWLVLVVGAAALANVLPIAEGRNPSLALDAPIAGGPDLLSAHPLGTDRQGLDVLAGVVFGARVSLVVGPGAVLLGLLVGGSLGVLAGYHRHAVEKFLNLISDALLALPALILLLALAAVVRPSVVTLTLVLGLLAAPSFYRLARANTMVFAQRGFVLAARALGARTQRVLLREIVPNVLLSVMSYAFIVVAALIVAEASLSFLGLGIARPQPTWGNMIAAGQADIQRYPHLVFVPGAVLFLTVLALNRVGDWARRHWDPRTRKI